MEDLWEKVNDIKDDVSDIIFDTIRDKLNRTSNEIGENHPEYPKLIVLENVFSLALNLDDPKEPYTFRYMLKDKRSIFLEVFNTTMTDTLKSIIDEQTLKSPLMLFRVMDVYWTLSKDYLIRENLFSNLMSSIDFCFRKEQYYLMTSLLERGFQLFVSEDKRRIQLIEKLDFIFNKYDFTRPLEPSIQRLMYQLLSFTCKYKHIKEEKYPGIGVEIAENLERNKDFYSAKHWWELCTKWFYKLNRNECALNCEKKKALSFYKMAREQLGQESVNYHIVVDNLNSAILSLRKVKGNEEVVKKWTIEKSEYEKKALDQFSCIEFPTIDISIELEEIEKYFNGKNPLEIIIIIGSLVRSLDYTKLLEEASKNNSIFNYGNRKKVNNEGENVHIARNDDEFSEYVLTTYLENYAYTASLIQHSIELLHNHHFLRTETLLAITTENIFIPEDRELIFAQGLREGLKGNYVTSLSILIPQFEHSIRFLLEKNGEIVTNLGEDSVQEEKTLNQLLSYNKLEDIFGLNVVKDLQHLFVNKGGENLRNKLSHGLLSSDEFHSPAAIYAFGIILKIISYFKIGY
ncbi:DUF4209 domain-containing protein [Bacillus pseudomycoides]|uniref:DUF4209 domain-containing protein n=1 Tax=Bacillus pseudomycoides TaxID=64104 RepID=UPI000BFA934F|nr:DUF4209 domain-containing protein [Bacillus pseudomycoides]PGC39178.1 hypothetical protein COM18_17705 [Bacillus pseudomycoides]